MTVTPRERELASFRAYLECGSIHGAASRLGLHTQTVKRHLALLKTHYGAETLAQLAICIERDTKGCMQMRRNRR